MAIFKQPLDEPELGAASLACLHCDVSLSMLRGIDWSGRRFGRAATISMGRRSSLTLSAVKPGHD